jgi:hypothetical protein
MKMKKILVFLVLAILLSACGKGFITDITSHIYEVNCGDIWNGYVERVLTEYSNGGFMIEYKLFPDGNPIMIPENCVWIEWLPE